MISAQQNTTGFFLSDLDYADRRCSCGTADACGGSCRVIELKDLINIYEEREVSM